MRHDGSVIGARREEVDAEADARRLGPSLLAHLPEAVRRPAYDRSALSAGIAHIGVGAFHRCHQAEYTDDLLHQRFDRWASSASISALRRSPIGWDDRGASTRASFVAAARSMPE